MAGLLTNEACEEIANAINAGPLSGTVKIHLFNSAFTPGPTTHLADFLAAEVNFTGYAAVAVVGPWTMGLDDSNNVQLQATAFATFAQTGTGNIDTAGGWWISDDPPTTVFGSGTFDSPFEFNKVGNTMNVQPDLHFPCTGDQTSSTIVGP